MKNKNQIYILLTDTGTVLNRLIKMYTKDPYNHVSISFDKDLKELYSFGRKKHYNPIIGGFVKENIDSIIFSNANCAVYCLHDIDDMTYDKIREYIKLFELNRDNYRYNLIGLFGIMFNIHIQRCDAFFCSQFVASVFEFSGRPIFDKPCVFVTPGDFQANQLFSRVYSGRLKDYRNFLQETESIPSIMFAEETVQA